MERVVTEARLGSCWGCGEEQRGEEDTKEGHAMVGTHKNEPPGENNEIKEPRNAGNLEECAVTTIRKDDEEKEEEEEKKEEKEE